jgi:hypothetical protein
LQLRPFRLVYNLVAIVIAIALHHVADANIVAALKAFSIIVTKFTGHIGMAILIAVIHVRLTMILIIFTGSNQAVLKATPFSIVVFRRCVIPPSVLAVSWWRRLLGVLSVHYGRRTQQ